MKQLFIFFIIAALFFCKTATLSAQVNVNDSLALVDLYNSTDGAHWTNHTNWLSGPVSTWYGVYLSGGRVTQIDLHINNVQGAVPASFGNLTELAVIWMSDNHLTGSLPSSFSNLTKLTQIYLSNNQLTGSLTALENCTDPFDFELSENKFTGPLPTLQNMDKIDLLNLDNNQLTGNIPISYGNFRGEQLTLTGNKLTGNIPASLGNLTTTTLVLLSDNQLTGPVPTSLLNLPSYAYLTLENNHFTYDGLEAIVAANPSFSFSYSPQLNIPITYTPQGAYGKLSVHAGGTLSNNTYQWYRNNSLYKTNVGDSAFIVDSPGVYFVKVNNSIATVLQLMSDSITIVAACSSPPTGAATTNIQQTSARFTWNAARGAIKYQLKYKVKGTSTFTTVNTKNTAFNLSGLISNTKYVWMVRSKCSLQYSAFSPLNNFKTLPGFGGLLQTDNEIGQPNSFTLYPNPARGSVNLMFTASKQLSYAISIYDLQGKMLLSKTGTTNPGNNNYELNIQALSSGTYIVKIRYDADKTIVQKLVKE